MFEIESKAKANNDTTALSIRIPRSLKSRVDALASALSQSTTEVVRQALEESLAGITPEQALLLLSDYMDLNYHTNGSLWLSSGGTDVFYLGSIDDFADWQHPWVEHEGVGIGGALDGEIDDLKEAIAEDLAKQIEGGIEEGAWHWEDWPKEVYHFAFSDRSEEWRNALAEVAEAMHIKQECRWDTTFDWACGYADTISSLASGQDPWRGDNEAYQEWKKEVKAKGLEGWE